MSFSLFPLGLKNFWKQNKTNIIFFGIIFLSVFLIYGRTLWGEFVFDDRALIDNKAFLASASNLPKTLLVPYWTEEAGLFRPITVASYALNYIFFGDSPWFFHFINLIFYVWTIYLIFLLIKKTFSNTALAYLSSLLFLVLPIHSEVVSNIIGRAEILALFFSLLVFWELIRKKTNYWRIFLWTILAIGSKETAFAILPLSALFVLFQKKEFSLKDSILRALNPLIVGIAAFLAYLFARLYVLGPNYFFGLKTSIVENPLMFASLFQRTATAFKILGIYFKKTFFPIGLCSDYSYNQIPLLKNLLDPYALLGIFILFFSIASLFLFFKTKPLLSFAVAIFILSFLPISNLFFPIGTIAGERLMFYPSLGLVIFIAYLLYSIYKLKNNQIWKTNCLFLIMGLLIFYGFLSFRRSLDWLNEKRLFFSGVQCAPNSVLSRSNFGAILYLQGNLSEAKKELIQAQKIYDNYPKGVNNLGLVYWKEGDRKKAKELFLKAVSSHTPYFGGYENLALMAIEECNFIEAENWLVKFYSGNKYAADIYINNFARQNSFCGNKQQK